MLTSDQRISDETGVAIEDNNADGVQIPKNIVNKGTAKTRMTA